MTPEQKRQAQRREFLRSHGFPLAAGTVAVGGLAVAIAIFLADDRQPPIRKAPDLTVVTLVEPPPPPPPPEVVEPEMVEQPEVVEPEIEHEEITEEPPEPSDEPPAEVASDEPPLGPLGLDAVAEGPGDAFNLAGRPGGNGLLGGGGGGGSRWGWYAYIVQQQLEQALRAHRRTRTARTQIEIRLWADESGRVTRVVLNPSTGNSAIDDAIKNEILAGLQLREPPPLDMPMPIVARVTARRPG